MAVNRGKQWEQKLKEDWRKLPHSTIDRLYDPGFGMKGMSNICDFIGYSYPNIYYLECKSISGNTFPLTGLRQYEKLLSKKNECCKGVRVGVVLWWVDKDAVAYVPIKSIEKMKADGKKSVNIKYLSTNEYNIIPVPGVKKRVFIDCDYSILTKLNDEEVVEDGSTEDGRIDRVN